MPADYQYPPLNLRLRVWIIPNASWLSNLRADAVIQMRAENLVQM